MNTEIIATEASSLESNRLAIGLWLGAIGLAVALIAMFMLIVNPTRHYGRHKPDLCVAAKNLVTLENARTKHFLDNVVYWAMQSDDSKERQNLYALADDVRREQPARKQEQARFIHGMCAPR